jgi:hypothetical protein
LSNLRTAFIATIAFLSCLALAGPQVKDVTVSPNTVIGGSSSVGYVSLTQSALPGGTVVSLASDNPAALLPSTVTVPYGATSKTFTVTTTGVAKTEVAHFTASAGGVTKKANLTIDAPTVSSVTFSPSTVYGAGTSTGTVTMNGPAPPGGMGVTVTSDNLAAKPQSPVTISAGSSEGKFTVTTSSVPRNETATIIATLADGSHASGTLDVDPPSVSSLSVSPGTVIGGEANALGTVELAQPAPAGGITVSLGSKSACASVPSSVTVAAGKTSATFNVTTKSVNANTKATLTASHDGASVTAVLSVDAPTLSVLALAPATIYVGGSSIATVTLSNPAPPGGAVLSLSSGNPSAVVPATTTVAAGMTSGTFYVAASSMSGSSATAVITAAYNGSRVSAKLTILIPGWTQPHGNPAGTGVGGGPAGGATPAIAWTFALNHALDRPIGPPVIGSDGTVYFSSTSGVYAVSYKGVGLWFWANSEPSSCPVIGPDGTLYVGNLDGGSGRGSYGLFALDPKNGDVEWRIFPDGAGQPIVGPDGTIYVCAANASGDVGLYALQPTGAVKWSVGSVGWPQPSLGPDGTVYVVEHNAVVAVTSKGAVKWTSSVPGADDAALITVGNEGSIFVVFGTTIMSLNAETGTVESKTTFPSDTALDSWPAISLDGTLLFGAGDAAFDYDPATWIPNWAFTGEAIMLSPVVGSDGTIYFPDSWGDIYSFTPDGKKRWYAVITYGYHPFYGLAIGSDGSLYGVAEQYPNSLPFKVTQH